MLAAVLPMATADAASLIEPTESPICESVLGRFVDFRRCATAHSDLVASLEFAAAVGPPTLAGTDTPRNVRSAAEPPNPLTSQQALAWIAPPEERFGGECPVSERTDLYADPTADWDGDKLTNIVEFYRGLDPCTFDSSLVAGSTVVAPVAPPEVTLVPESVVAGPVAGSAIVADATDAELVPEVCPTYSFSDVLDDPEGDWDQDTLSNSFEMHNQFDPCTFDVVGPGVPVELATGIGDPATTPCPEYAIEDVIADQYSDWDRDGILNGFEFHNNLNPCVSDEQVPASLPNFVPPEPDQSVTPCPIYSVEAILDDPDGDWDYDRASNSFELYNNSNPC
ncbi:MAG: hypothetical protein ACI9BK_001924, partial [Acidimicrobiales bacterium]